MKNSRFHRLVTITCFFSLLFATQTVAQEWAKPKEQIWMNREGRKITAELIGYDVVARQVQFRLADGSFANVSIHDLKWFDRISAVMSNPVREATAGKGNNAQFAAALLVFFSFLAVVGFLPRYAGFHAAARLITGRKGYRNHFIGFLKVFGVGLGAVFILIGLGYFFIKDTTAEETGGMEAILLVLGVGLGALVATVMVSMGHYETGFFRSFGILILSDVMANIFFILFVIVASFILPLTGSAWFESLADGAVDQFFLRPAGIVPVQGE